MKGLFILLICLLTIYAPLELTWVIVDWGLSDPLILEMCLMWLLYAMAIFIISAVVIKRI